MELQVNDWLIRLWNICRQHDDNKYFVNMDKNEFINNWIYNNRIVDNRNVLIDFSRIFVDGKSLAFEREINEKYELYHGALIPKADIKIAFDYSQYGISMKYSYGYFDHNPYHTSVRMLYGEVSDIERYYKMWLLLLIQDASKDYFRVFGELSEMIENVYFQLLTDLSDEHNHIYFGNAKNMLPEGSYKRVLKLEDPYAIQLYLQNRMNIVRNNYYMVVYDGNVKLPAGFWKDLGL